MKMKMFLHILATVPVYTLLLIGCYLPLVSSQTTFIATNFGRDEADKLWRSKRYDRNDMRSFERRVRNDVYGKCDDSFKFNREWARACKDGAKDYVDEMKKKCSGTGGGSDECKDLGEVLVSQSELLSYLY
eukprot:744480_1